MRFSNILLIDDDTDDQELFLAALDTIPGAANCTTVSYARDAIKKLVSKEIVPDIIFLDLNMPVMTGQQFLMEMKNNAAIKDIPIIIFSTTSNRTTIDLMLELGAYRFITKPAKFDELVDAIRSAIHS